MRVTYVLPLPELSGGNKVAFQHAELLLSRGHEVTILGQGPQPAWIDFSGRYCDYSASSPALPSQDLLIGTFWVTLELAEKLQLGPVAHFCQGYEGSFDFYRDLWPQIDAQYGRKRPTLVVTPRLGEVLAERFSIHSRVVPPPLDPKFKPALRWGPRRPSWIALGGIFQAEVKGIRLGIEVVRRLRDQGIGCRLLRYAPEPLCDAEREHLVPDRYLYRVPPNEIAEALRRCDLLLLPSQPEEGFGLPLLEAMACRVPAIASRIPSTEYMTAGSVRLVEVGDTDGFVAAAAELLDDPRAWRQARVKAAKRAVQFAPERIGEKLEAAVEWAIDASLPP